MDMVFVSLTDFLQALQCNLFKEYFVVLNFCYISQNIASEYLAWTYMYLIFLLVNICLLNAQVYLYYTTKFTIQHLLNIQF